ncbi:hypothetical protein ERJ75_000365100 [Trypanosoma vivax]|nr:hypothetical protein ERJ75_000365100 [Trypanosoma vivax]
MPRTAFYCEFEPGEKQRRAAHKGVAVADGGWEGPASDVSFGPLEGNGGISHKAGAADDAVGAWPRLRRVPVRLARVTTGRWGEVALLLKENSIEHPSDRNALTVDWALCQKHSGQARTEQRATWWSRAWAPTW